MRDLTIEYVLFTLIVILSFGFTVYRNVIAGRETTKNDYVFAGQHSISYWTMLVSIARGFLGVRVFLGYPSELFYRGCELWETLYGILLAFPITMYLFIPMYMNVGITSVYQYLDMRFKSKIIRCMASASYILRTLMLVSVSTFTPCIAMKTILGISYYLSIPGITVISIICTFSGGFRSALMGDVIQGVLMMVVCLVLIVWGTIEAGGPLNVIKINSEAGRLNFFNFDLDPTKRATTVSALVGHLFISLSMYGCQQNYVQRYISMKTKEKVNRTLLLSIPFTIVAMSLSWVVGMVILAHYLHCDPRKLKYIDDIDELFPFYLEDKFLFIPGLLGIILGTLFNAGLTAIISNVNSISTVLWEDFFLCLTPFKKVTNETQVLALKFICAACSVIIMFITFGISQLSGIIQISIIMTSATSGPLLGVFILAILFPCANWKGTAIGMMAGFLVMIWLNIGAAMLPKSVPVYLATSTDQCTNDTFNKFVVEHRLSEMSLKRAQTPVQVTNDTSPLVSQKYVSSDRFLDVNKFYEITFLYYSVVGTVTTVVVALIFSLITSSYAEDYENTENLIHPSIIKLRSYRSTVPIEIR